MVAILIQSLYGTLHANRLMRSESEVAAFDEALAALATYSHAQVESTLPELLLVFDDECEHHEVMWGLLHYIESFDFETTIRALGFALPAMSQSAPKWADLFFFRILNSEEWRIALKQILPTLPKDSQQVIKRVLRDITTHGEKHAQVAHVLGEV